MSVHLSAAAMQDYIMRLIQQVAHMLAAVMGHRTAGRRDEAQAEIERLCLQVAALPLSMIKQASPEALRGFLQMGGPQQIARDIVLAELLLQDADLHDDTPDTAQAARAHAFCLISDRLGSLSADDSKHYAPKLAALHGMLADRQLDPYVAAKLQNWRTKNAGEPSTSGSTPPASAP